MVSKVAISSFRQFIQQNLPSAKITKIAFAAIGFLVLALTAIVCRKKEALLKNIQIQDPKFDPRVLKLIGGMRGLDKLSRIKPTERKEGEVSATEKEQAIVSDNRAIRYPPIRWGYDAWGCLFIWISFIDKRSQAPLFSLIYENMESGQLRWYLNKAHLFEMDPHFQVLRRVIAKTDDRFELAEAKPVKALKSSEIVDDLFSTIDPELAEILGGKNLINSIPIKYIPEAVNNTSASCKQGLVSAEKKLAALLQIAVRDTFIFRGIDDWGFPFIVIKYVEKANFKPHTLCFYQNEEKDETIWYFNEMKFYGRLLPNGCRETRVNHSARSLIRDLILVGANYDYQLGSA